MTITLWVLLGVTVVLIAYDVWRYFKRDESTISETIYAVAKRYPVIAFALGFLMGHLLWTQ